MEYVFYDSVFDENKNNLVDELIHEMRLYDHGDKDPNDPEQPEREQERKDMEIQKKFDMLLARSQGLSGPKKPKKPKKPTKVSPRFLIIFDDLPATELRNKSVESLLKTNRHYKSKVFVSSQWPSDLTPGSKKQMQYFILFGGVNKEKLDQVYESADLPNIPFETFMSNYREATRDKFNFFYFSTTGEMRKIFSERFE